MLLFLLIKELFTFYTSITANARSGLNKKYEYSDIAYRQNYTHASPQYVVIDIILRWLKGEFK